MSHHHTVSTPNHRFKVCKSKFQELTGDYDTVTEKLAFKNLDNLKTTPVFLEKAVNGTGVLEAGTGAGGKCVKMRLKSVENTSECTRWP